MARQLIDAKDDRSGTAALILACLLLRYRGRYRLQSGDREIKPCGTSSMRWSATRRSCRPRSHPGRTSDALPGKSLRRVPTLWPWLVAIPAVLVAYLLASHALWRHGVNDIGMAADAILSNTPPPPPETGRGKSP